MSLEGKAAPGYELKGKLAGLKTIHGYSAYEVAVINGFEGAEEEWLASIKGADGRSAYDIALSYGYEGTEEEFYSNLSLFDERAEVAQTSAASAVESASAAATSEANARNSETLAGVYADSANEAASGVEVARESAEASATAAEESANDARIAKAEAEAVVGTAAETAAKKAASGVEQKLSGYVGDAQAAKTGAEAARAAAERARDDAQSIAGGDFASTGYVDGKADLAESNAKAYADEKIANIPTPDVSGQIADHNAAINAHSDIRNAVSAHTSNKNNPHGVTAAQVGAVPTSRTVNGKALSANISLGASDVGADASGSAATALTNAKAYTDQKIAAIPTPDVSGQINTHNTSTSAHSDIRASVANAIGTAASAQNAAVSAVNAANSKAPMYTYGTTDLEDGVTPLASGMLHFVYEAPTISFTIAGTSYKAGPGMTWAEWADSSYAPSGMTIGTTSNTNENYIMFPNGDFVALNGVIEDYNNKIVAGTAYGIAV